MYDRSGRCFKRTEIAKRCKEKAVRLNLDRTNTSVLVHLSPEKNVSNFIIISFAFQIRY